jgi:hypothetical protein
MGIAIQVSGVTLIFTGESSEILIPSESTFDKSAYTIPQPCTLIMAPDRPHPHRKNAKAGPSSTPGVGKPLPYEKRDGSGVPGVSKLKASIRQTKRFLAKVSRDVDSYLSLTNFVGHSRTWTKNLDRTTTDLPRG